MTGSRGHTSSRGAGAGTGSRPRRRLSAQVSSAPHPHMRLKLLTLGDVGVGKSCIIRRYMHTYESSLPALAPHAEHEHPWKSQPEPTVGVDTIMSNKPYTRTNSSRTVRVIPHIFDLSGSPQYSKIRAEFYGDYHGLIVVFDCTSKPTFDRLEEWIKEATVVTPPDGGSSYTVNPSTYRVLVLCNKIDVKQGRVVTERDARKWATNKGYEYHEVSAKSGNNVSRAIDSLINLCEAEIKGNTQSQSQSQSQSHSHSHSKSNSNSNPQSNVNSRANSNPSSRPHSTGLSSSLLSLEPNSMSISELRRVLSEHHVDSSDCLEKSDLVNKLQTFIQQFKDRAESHARTAEEESQRDAIRHEIDEWTKGKDIIAMLNHVHGHTPGSSSYLVSSCDSSVIYSSYKRALLKIHPDKHDSSDVMNHFRTTETFKAVNAAMDHYKKYNDKATNHKQGQPTTHAHTHEQTKPPTRGERKGAWTNK